MKKIIIILLLLTYDSFSQSLSVFDIDTSAFPTIKAKFYAFDVSGNQILNLSPSDFEVTEDGVQRNVTYVSCPAPKPPVPISSVLTIDVSGSMGGSGIGYAKEAAKAWVQALPLGQSECAITSFNSNNFFNQDFTTNRNRLLNRIEELTTSDGTDFNAALINPMSGGLLAVEKGKYKRVVILLTDGYASGNEFAIIQKANKINAIVFCVTIATPCPPILRNISEQTGGQWFENITTAEQAREVYLKILNIVQEGEPCEIEWESDFNCTNDNIKLVFNLKLNNSFCNISYKPSYKSIANIEFLPTSMFFKNKGPGVKHDTTVTITARKTDFEITNIISSNPAFSILPTSFTLKEGESKELTVTFLPPDSNYHYSSFSVESNICKKEFYASGAFNRIRQKTQTLKLTHPNGGEVFVVGSDTMITWEGIAATDTVTIEYSNDNGITWNLITNEASGLQYIWKNVPKPISDSCLVKIIQYYGNSINDLTPKIEWENNFGGSDYDNVQSITETIDSGYVAVGYTSSDDGDVIGFDGNSDFWIIKLNSSGDLMWQRTFGGTLSDWAYSVQQTRDGGCIVAGATYSKDGDVVGNKGQMDALILKLTPTGSIEWQKNFGGSRDDGARSVIQTTDGGYIFGGITESSDGDVSGHKGNLDFWIVKLSESGNIEWQKCLGGYSYEYLTSIIQIQNGDYVVTGYTSSNDGDVTNNKGGLDFWVVKLNQIGILEWQRNFGGSGNDYPNSIKSTIDSGYIVAGFTESQDGDVKGFKGYYDYWIVKLNNNGLIEWQRTLGGSESDAGSCIIETNDGGYLVGGKTESKDGDVLKLYYPFDGWIVKLSSDGNIKWQKNFGGDDYDEIEWIEKTRDNGFILASNSSSRNLDVSGNKGKSDFWIVKLSSEGMVLQEDISDSIFSIVAPQAASQNIDMGKVVVTNIKDSVVNNFISNIGSWIFRVDSIYFRGADASAFSMLAGFPKYEVEAGKSNFAEFRFAPTEVKNYQAEVVIITQADTLIQNIIGEGVREELAVFGDIIDFGIREIANFKDSTMVLITNSSSNPVDINSIIMLGPDKEQFEFVNGNVTPLTLNSGESHTMTIRFNPKYIGRTSGQIGFFHNAAGSPSTVQLFGAGIGAQISASFDSAYAGEVIDANIKLESGNLTKFAELIGSFDGVFRVENSILAPINKSNLSKTQNDSAYIKFSGNVNPMSSTLATLKLKAGLGRVEETSIDFENINWYDTDGNLLNYDTEFSSGHFKLLGICREGGTRLVNPNAQAGMMTIAPNPAENKLDISLLLTEKGYAEICIYNVLGEVVTTIFSEDVVQYNTREISTDLSGLSTGQYLIILRTPTYVESSRLMIIK